MSKHFKLFRLLIALWAAACSGQALAQTEGRRLYVIYVNTARASDEDYFNTAMQSSLYKQINDVEQNEKADLLIYLASHPDPAERLYAGKGRIEAFKTVLNKGFKRTPSPLADSDSLRRAIFAQLEKASAGYNPYSYNQLYFSLYMPQEAAEHLVSSYNALYALIDEVCSNPVYGKVKKVNVVMPGGPEATSEKLDKLADFYQDADVAGDYAIFSNSNSKPVFSFLR